MPLMLGFAACVMPRSDGASPFSSTKADPGTESGMTQWETQSLAKSKNVEPRKYRKAPAERRLREPQAIRINESWRRE